MLGLISTMDRRGLNILQRALIRVIKPRSEELSEIAGGERRITKRIIELFIGGCEVRDIHVVVIPIFSLSCELVDS